MTLFALMMILGLFFYRGYKGKVPFMSLTKICAYYLLPYVIFNLIGRIIGFGLISIIGIIISIVYMNIGKNELYKLYYMKNQEDESNGL